MTIRQCIKKNGWQLECETEGCRAMSVDVDFFNGTTNDETQFDITAYNADELAELFKEFCKENGYPYNRVTSITIVKAAGTMDELQRM